MFRSTAARSVRSLSRPNPRVLLSRAANKQFLRFESNDSQTPPVPETKKKTPLKEAQEWADELRRDWDAKMISYEDLKPKTLSPTADSYLIDVREPDEVLQGMIPSAVNVPLTTLPTALQLSPEHFEEKYGFTKPRKAQEVTFYCRSGKRSSTAADVAKRNGFTNIINYKGSWLDWVEKEGKK